MVALLFDIHGNLPALEAVLTDATDRGAKRFLLGGDFTLFGAWPAETVARLRELDATWIRGNGERWTADPGSAPDDPVVKAAIAACRERLGTETVDELGQLDDQTAAGDGTRYCHASPVSDVRGFAPDRDAGDSELIGAARERRLVFGHTHLQFARTSASGVELINPGSVGMPFDGDTRAAYGLATAGEGPELIRVAYDAAASADAVRRRLGSFAEPIARRIEHARFVT